MPTDSEREGYYTKIDAMKRQAQQEQARAQGFTLRQPELSPYVEAETQKILQKAGDYSAAGALGLGAAAALGAPPLLATGALALGATSAGMYVAEGLTDARQGRKKEGAAKIALGLLEAGTTKRMAAAPTVVALSKSPVGRTAQKASAYVPAAKNLGYDVGINMAQDVLRDYADSSDDAELAAELRRYVDDPAQLQGLRSRMSAGGADPDEDRDMNTR
jgi:hypothetical protein